MSAQLAGPATPGPSPARGWAQPSSDELAVAVRAVAALAAAVLAVAGTGSATVAALLLGAAVADRRTVVAAALAVLAAGIRFRTDAFDDLAGIQSVLGIAGEVGPPAAAASAWLAAAAVLLAVRPLAGAARSRALRLLPALPGGLLAAALVAGPGPDALPVRVLASVVAVVLAAGVARLTGSRDERAGRSAGATTGNERTDPRWSGRLGGVLPWLAVAAGIAAVVLAGWPS